MEDSRLELPSVESGPGSTTTRCPVRLGLSDGRALDAAIYLLSDSTRPGGVVTVEATLDGSRAFIPVQVEGVNALIGRHSIRFVEMAADAPGAGDLPEIGAMFDLITLRLDSGEEFTGLLRTLAPVDSMRMSDVFNKPGRFLALSVTDRLVLIAKEHLVQVSF